MKIQSATKLLMFVAATSVAMVMIAEPAVAQTAMVHSSGTGCVGPACKIKLPPIKTDSAIAAIDADPVASAQLNQALAANNSDAIKQILSSHGATGLENVEVRSAGAPPPVRVGARCHTTRTVKEILFANGSHQIEITTSTTC